MSRDVLGTYLLFGTCVVRASSSQKTRQLTNNVLRCALKITISVATRTGGYSNDALEFITYPPLPY